VPSGRGRPSIGLGPPDVRSEHLQGKCQDTFQEASFFVCRHTDSSIARACCRLVARAGTGLRGQQVGKAKSTQIYTHVALRGLQEVHAATHPAEAMNYRSFRSRKGAAATPLSAPRGLAPEVESGSETTGDAGFSGVVSPASFDSAATVPPTSKIL
jgi:hypothetical protein